MRAALSTLLMLALIVGLAHLRAWWRDRRVARLPEPVGATEEFGAELRAIRHELAAEPAPEMLPPDPLSALTRFVSLDDRAPEYLQLVKRMPADLPREIFTVGWTVDELAEKLERGRREIAGAA